MYDRMIIYSLRQKAKEVVRRSKLQRPDYMARSLEELEEYLKALDIVLKEE